MLVLEKKEFEKKLLEFLKSRGRLKVAILSKIEKHFCSEKSIFRILESTLYDALISLVHQKKIDLIIIKPFQVTWTEEFLSRMRYLKDGTYYTRKIENINLNYKTLSLYGNYLFDSRKFRGEKKEVKYLRLLIADSVLKDKTLIIYGRKRMPLCLFENMDNIYYAYKKRYKNSFIMEDFLKISIPLNLQDVILSGIKSYRKNFMCSYITLIETLHNSIINYQQKKINLNSNKDYINLINRFAHYSILFLKSNWVEIKEASVNRWETFFKFFNIPINLLDGQIQSIDFFGRVFETDGYSPLCIYINKYDKDTIKGLVEKGYQILNRPEIDNQIPVGLELKTQVLCPAIEYYFFIYKYVIYYYLFKLFYDARDYIRKIKINLTFSKKELEIYKLFEPVMYSFFDFDPNKISEKLKFNYITYNADELEILYNIHLMKNARIIEKKLYQYFLFRHSRKTK